MASARTKAVLAKQPIAVFPDRTANKLAEISQLLRARSFWVVGETLAAERVRSNLQTGPAQLCPEATAWVSTQKMPLDKLGIGLAEGPALLGPHSFGFLNNVDGIAPLSAPLGDRPRLGRVALVVPRRDALPELAPLLCSRQLGVSWLISVGDGDPADVLSFLQHDPATLGVLLAVGKGVRPHTLLERLPNKPTCVLLPPGNRELVLLGAVARRAAARSTDDLEEWLACAALLDAGVGWPFTNAVGAAKKSAVRVVVVGAGADLVHREAAALQLPPPMRLDADEPAELEQALAKNRSQADFLVLCGAIDQLVSLKLPHPSVLVDSSERDRLRALLQLLKSLSKPTLPHLPATVRPARERLEQVLAELPPPLFVGGAMVKQEPLLDHDTKRLLAAYGVLVSRQAPVNTTTAALRVVSKLQTPVFVLPGLPPAQDVLHLAKQEMRLGVLCHTQADVKRHTALLLERHEYVVLREEITDAPILRIQVQTDRSLGRLLRLTLFEKVQQPDAVLEEAALLPVFSDEAGVLAQRFGISEEPWVTLLGQISACFVSQRLDGDLLLRLTARPVVTHAVGVLLRS